MSIPFIQINALQKEFSGHRVLDGINLNINEGEVVVILGPSGCGKSTLLRCLNGLEKKSAGQIVFSGVEAPMDEAGWRQRRASIGMVFQNYHLFPHLNVLDNIVLGPSKVLGRPRQELEREAHQLLERVGLAHKWNAYPRELSGGQQQRIAIVRALAMKPEVMLFDEVTAALDPEMVKEVLEVILQLAAEGMTMLLVTHELAFARAVADRIIFMDQGRICEQADPEQFFNQPRTERARQFLDKFSYLERLPHQQQGKKNHETTTA